MPDAPHRLALLGPPRLEHAGLNRPLAPERRFQLLAFLAHQADWVERERLAALFWPGHGGEAARRNLRKVLFRLREWPGAPPLEERAGALRCQAGTDLHDFETALAAGRPADALALWRGEPWAGLDRDASPALADWLGFERHRLLALWRDALLRLAASDDAEQVLAHARPLLRADPLDEDAVRLAMRAHAQAGRPAEARRVYESFASALGETLGLEPSRATRALLAPSETRPANSDGSAASSPSSAPATPTALVPPDTSLAAGIDAATPAGAFIGREAEQRDLTHQLADPACRWLTITGPGGIGKSRLLRRWLAVAGGDTCWVPLADLAGPARIGSRLCERLGLEIGGAVDPFALAAQALRERQAVIALDNLEHLLPAVPALESLLRECPGIRLVVTSRERCGAAGEWLLPLLGLPHPAGADADRADAFDAVRLFAQRAREADPRFSLAGQRDAVIALCEAVEGLPLAIELAAAWSRHLRVDEIVRDLRAGELLDEAAAGRPGVAATIELSWRRLVPAERAAFAAASVFHGGCTHEAARRVAGASLVVLGALLDKSLLRRDESAAPRAPAVGEGVERSAAAGGSTAPDATRFSLHPLLQRFARAKLALDAEAQAAAEREHAEFFTLLLARMPPPDQAAAMTAWCRAHRAELDNFGAAWRWAAAHERIDLLRAAATPLRIAHYANARWREGLALLEAAEGAAARDPVALARIEVSRVVLLYNLGRCAEAVALARRALPALRRGGEPRMLSQALVYAGQAEVVLGHAEAARAFFDESLAVARRHDDRLAMSNALGNLATIDYLAGRYEAARDALRECVALREAIGGEIAQVLSNLGVMELCAGEPVAAITTLERGLRRCGAEANPSARAHLNYNLVSARLALGELDAAERLASDTTELIADGTAPVLAIQLGLLRARIAGQRGDQATAERLLRAATHDAWRREIEPALLSAAAHWAEWRGRDGQAASALELIGLVVARADLEHAEREFAERVRAAIEAAHGANPAALARGAARRLGAAIESLLAR